MKLILQNGYPYPYPTNLTQKEQDELAEAAAGHRLELEGVCFWQWLHTMTVQFKTFADYEKAKQLTGWEHWSYDVLEAPTSSADGYEHPAIVAAGMAYCGFIFTDE